MIAPQPTQWLYTHLIKPLFFRIPPETMHTLFGHVGHFLGKYQLTRWLTRQRFHFEHPALVQHYAGLTFTNPVGLAAGFDKDVQLCHIISDVGFGYTEIGSITAEPYAGNPAPRLYRLQKAEGLIVYYGLKNHGAARAIKKLQSYSKITVPVIVSIAKTNCQRTTDPEIGKNDYLATLDQFVAADLGDIYELNISCPNAFGGENFAHQLHLEALLSEITSRKVKKPLLVKLPVDISRTDLQPLLDCCVRHHVTGVVISNLTKQRDHIPEQATISHLHGGISGKPVREKSNELIAKTYTYCGDKLLIIGVGGIFSAEDAYEKIKQGASLVQLITGMIFQGPQLIGQINAGLVTLLQKDGYSHISQAVGSAHR